MAARTPRWPTTLAGGTVVLLFWTLLALSLRAGGGA
jgi:hypothetical protein